MPAQFGAAVGLLGAAQIAALLQQPREVEGARRIAALVGTSEGLFGALQIARELQKSGRGGCAVAIVADRGDRSFAPMRWERRYVW